MKPDSASAPGRPPDRSREWDADLPRAIPFGAALLTAGIILLATTAHILVAVVCVLIGAALLLRSLRQVRATLFARHPRRK